MDALIHYILKARIITYSIAIQRDRKNKHQPKIIRTTITQGGAELAGGEVRSKSVMNVERAPAAATSQPSVRSVITVPTPAASQGTTGRDTRARARANRLL